MQLSCKIIAIEIKHTESGPLAIKRRATPAKVYDGNIKWA